MEPSQIPRKRGQGITQTDLLVINKTDLAPYVGADLAVMARDAGSVRANRPFRFTNCRSGEGVQEVMEVMLEGAGVTSVRR
jgi:urease accessory protein